MMNKIQTALDTHAVDSLLKKPKTLLACKYPRQGLTDDGEVVTTHIEEMVTVADAVLMQRLSVSRCTASGGRWNHFSDEQLLSDFIVVNFAVVKE